MGALLGLLGQEAAFAQSIPVKPVDQSVTAGQMSADCAEMMGLAKQNSQPDKPCQGMTPDCAAKMGCAVVVAVLPNALIDLAIGAAADGSDQIPVVRLVGRNLTPEPEPPAPLG